jgi:hypothetical protein
MLNCDVQDYEKFLKYKIENFIKNIKKFHRLFQN